jgi:hypothetical protein
VRQAPRKLGGGLGRGWTSKCLGASRRPEGEGIRVLVGFAFLLLTLRLRPVLPVPWAPMPLIFVPARWAHV